MKANMILGGLLKKIYESKELLVSFLAIVISIIALIGALSTSAPTPVSSDFKPQAEERSILSVTGKGEVVVEPDIVSVVLAVEVEKPKAEEALGKAAEIMNSIIDNLLGIGINRDNITTSGFSLYPVYEYTEKKPILVGYRVINRITVRVSTAEKAGEVIDIAVSSGANRVDSITFTLSSGKYKSAYHKALSLAVKEAREKAEIVASAAGVEIVKILEIEVQPLYYVPVRYEMTEKADLGTPILEGELTVSAQVNIVFEVKS